MPALIGGIALPLLSGIALLLDELPEPTAEEKNEKSERVPLHKTRRRQLLKQYAFFLTPLCSL
jgi:hypothetical protein